MAAHSFRKEDLEYMKFHRVFHIFENAAFRLCHERPQNPISYLRDYFQLLDTVSNKYQCEFCYELLAFSTTETHMQTCRNAPFRCSNCNLAFFDNNSLQSHKSVHITSSNADNFVTQDQDSSSWHHSDQQSLTDPPVRLLLHPQAIVSNHEQTNQQVATIESPNVFADNDLSIIVKTNSAAYNVRSGAENSVEDSNCNFTIKNVKHTVHDICTSEPSIPITKKRDSKKVSLLKKATNRRPLFLCGICHRSFKIKSNLRRHMIIHTGEKSFVCRVCNKVFARKQSLSVHLRTHTGEKPYMCDVCSKAFAQVANLSSHLRTHTGEKPYICDVCSKTFSLKHNLSAHLRTHTGEKPYSCDVCSKTFTQKASLSYHLRTHTGEKPYSCDVCSKAFARKDTLTGHLRTHKAKDHKNARKRPFVC